MLLLFLAGNRYLQWLVLSGAVLLAVMYAVFLVMFVGMASQTAWALVGVLAIALLALQPTSILVAYFVDKPRTQRIAVVAGVVSTIAATAASVALQLVVEAAKPGAQ